MFIRWTTDNFATSTMAAASMVTAERALVARLGGGCQTPIGAVAACEGTQLDLRAVVASLDGARAVRGRLRGEDERHCRKRERNGGALSATRQTDKSRHQLTPVRSRAGATCLDAALRKPARA